MGREVEDVSDVAVAEVVHADETARGEAVFRRRGAQGVIH